MKWIRKPEHWISVLGILVATALFVAWLIANPTVTWPGILAALASLTLFVVVCLRFVSKWFQDWRAPKVLMVSHSLRDDTPRYIEGKIFLGFFVTDIGVIVLVYLLRGAFGYTMELPGALEFWRCTDSEHYLNISRDWYLSTGDMDRLSELVFLPGYPILVRLFTYIVGNDLYAGLIVSALAFAGSGSMFYRLLRLDLPHRDAIRAIRWMCILPGVFFFVAPMSDGLFMLLCACCLYFARTNRWTLGCAFGAMACFTRSTALSLLIPLIFELVQARNQGAKKNIRRSVSLLLLPVGFGGYCLINYLVSGNWFMFMTYEQDYWSQGFGLFFNTASYQTEYALANLTTKIHSVLGLWIPNLLACFGVLILFLFVAKKMRSSYTAWFLAYFFVAIGSTWLLSGPRYLVALLPVPMAMSLVTHEKKTNWILTGIFICLSILYLCEFVLRWQVW